MHTSNDRSDLDPALDTDLAPRIAPAPARTGSDAAPGCEHAWSVESRHRTSEGVLSYVRCVRCGDRRIDVTRPGGVVPVGVCRPVASPHTREVSGTVEARRPAASVRRRMARVSRLWVLS
ncbi:hypothetical protein [Millisia brevis]|uniref:hypothetical protein n=1 Tax=Millisia brevis TaxID=264148 RepID=UPI00083060D5|nr:hypothetical protein [Millisia brevis]